MSQTHKTNRRGFLKQAAAGAVAAPFFIRNLISAPPSGKLRLASFGADGMAYETLFAIARHPNVTLVSAAEVDSTRLKSLAKVHPEAVVYTDWRRMLDKERRNLDFVCVGTPDHMHAPMAMTSMQLGLHAYVQKPLTHDIYETRKLTEMARKKKLVTQMGIQQHSSAEYRTAVQVVQSGAIGKVREVHAWSNKRWGDPDPLPSTSDPVPETLDWDQWLGVAAVRPYIRNYYHPGNWRKRIDFGTATFGDMGCHIYDPVFSALELTAPVTVRSEGTPPNRDNWAVNTIVHYVFPGTRFTEGNTVNVTWYDGDERPPKEVQASLGAQRLPGQGSIFIGSKGTMLLPHTAFPVLLPAEQFKDVPVSKLEPLNHYFQFVNAVLGKEKATTALDYAGPLTESVLLGTVASFFPKTTLEWNAAKLKFRNSKEATRHVRRAYRSGWKVKGL